MDAEVYGNDLYFGSLYNTIILNPIQQGATHLTAAVGYASASFASQILTENEDVSLRLLIGMAKQSGISLSDHNMYIHLEDLYPRRFTPHYYIGNKPVHAKVYGWSMMDKPIIGFVGSPNFSWSAYLRHHEAVAEHSAGAVLELYDRILSESLHIKDGKVAENISIFDPRSEAKLKTASTHGLITEMEEEIHSVTLSLLTAQGDVHKRSGLNWGQRGNRNPNEAYIPIPQAVHQENPGFFPPKGFHFTIRTDDGHEFMGVIAQQNNKAIETPEGNYILGEYFRKRIGLNDGAYVNLEDLQKYGRATIDLSKIDDDLYLLDFSN